MSLTDIIGEYGLVIKVDVSDLEKSVSWYSEKLHFEIDTRYNTETWRQLNIPDVTSTAVGLNLNPQGIGTGGETTTFVVDDIVAARNELLRNDVYVGAIIRPGEGVQLAYFSDPDGNKLGLRENPPEFPKARQVGA